MNLYFAPMEGITGSVYRSAHQHIFGGIDRYYAPFIFTNEKGKISGKDRKEIYPEYNEGFVVVPQLLSNNAHDFVAMSKTLKTLGYREVNLNLGCPSQTVVSKGRGSGALKDIAKLDQMLGYIFDNTDIAVSIKTRIGVMQQEEFEQILKVYQKYPLVELIIHPRCRTDFYKGKPNIDLYKKTEEHYQGQICYNGDIFLVQDYKDLQSYFWKTSHWMMGRGMLTNPALAREIKGGPAMTRDELKAFYNEIKEAYTIRLNGSRKVISLMKELWKYLRFMFSVEDQQEVFALLKMNDDAEFAKESEHLLNYVQIQQKQGFGYQPDSW